jgi:hypothetical protein
MWFRSHGSATLHTFPTPDNSVSVPGSANRRRNPDWTEFYKNGLPKEIIVIDSDTDDDHVDHDNSSNYGDDGKGGGGFAGSDSKTQKRGVRSLLCPFVSTLLTRHQRAPPPGRCHSCNRAETTEWRRGPDGAQTLCNACGLRKVLLYFCTRRH